MKRTLFITWLSVMAISLGACANDNSKSGITVTQAKLTEREKAILTNATDKSFVFDFKIDSEYKEVSVWVEKYEFGKMVDDKSYVSTEIENRGSIIFTTSMANADQASFNVSISSDGTTSKVSHIETISEDMSSLGGSNQEENLPIEGEMVLASLCYASGEDVMSSLTTDFYNDVEGNIDEIKDYDVVYLLKSEFIK